MPELPEVETVANGVHDRVHGQQITSVWTSGKPQTFKSPESEIAEVLTGATITRVRRVGKTIVMSLDIPALPPQPAEATPATRSKRSRPTSPATTPERGAVSLSSGRVRTPIARPAHTHPAEFLIHLGMTGRLLVSHPDIPRPPHTHAVLTLADGPITTRELRFVDPRRFGRLSVHREPYLGPGREPLTISPAEFANLFRNRKTPIKAALLNQSLLHGVGNIYADEALARASIRPRKQAARLTRAELARLHSALHNVLHRAIELGGSSVSDYVDADGATGFFQLEHLVYARENQPCRTCGTPIKKITIAGRGTHFCPTCQR